MKKLTFLLFIISFISCGNKKQADTSPQVHDEVNTFYDHYLAHLSTKGLMLNELITNSIKYAFMGHSSPTLSIDIKEHSIPIEIFEQ